MKMSPNERSVPDDASHPYHFQPQRFTSPHRSFVAAERYTRQRQIKVTARLASALWHNKVWINDRQLYIAGDQRISELEVAVSRRAPDLMWNVPGLPRDW